MLTELKRLPLLLLGQVIEIDVIKEAGPDSKERVLHLTIEDGRQFEYRTNASNEVILAPGYLSGFYRVGAKMR